MWLRVILDSNNIQRLKIDKKPSTLDELKNIISNHLRIPHGMSLQFADPEFDNQLCNLNDIEDLPDEKATVKVLWELVLNPVQD